MSGPGVEPPMTNGAGGTGGAGAGADAAMDSGPNYTIDGQEKSDAAAPVVGGEDAGKVATDAD